MLLEERWQLIMEAVQQKRIVSVADLSKNLNTSDVTIRKDLTSLEEKTGKIKRTHGGAIWIDFTLEGMNYEPLYSVQESENKEAKRQICATASKLIQDNMAIIIDASTTAKYLTEFIRQDAPKGLSVVTNSVRVVMALSDLPNIEVLLTGGQIRKGINSCIGNIAENTLKQVRVDRAFLGMNGIDFSENILTMPNSAEGSVKSGMIASARETIILADHTKFNRTYLFKVCNATDVSMILTEQGVDPAVMAQADKCGANLKIVE